MSGVDVVPSPRTGLREPYGVSRRGAFVISFLARASAMGTISIISPYLLDRGVPVSLLGLVMVGSALGSGAFALIAGRLVDRLGAWWVLVCGCLVSVAGVLALVSAPTWQLMTASFFCSSAGMAAISNTLRTTIGLTTPEEDQEKVFGQLTSVATVGALIGPILVGLVVVQSTAAAPWFAITMLTVATLTSLASRRPGVSARLAQPESAEQEPDPSAPSTFEVIKAILPITALVTTIATMYGVYATVWGVYLRELGAADPVIAWSFVATMLPVVVLSPHARRVLPRAPRWMVAGGSTLCLGLLAFVYAITTTVWLAIVVSVAEGVLMSVSLPITYSLIARQAPKGGLGRAFGATAAADSVSSGVGTAVAGTLIAAGGVAYSFRLAGAYCVAGTTLALVWWWRHRPAS
ncbi:MAG: MFS transporter [Streptosporangiaceae bacterium]